jgi:hypothetical protein
MAPVAPLTLAEILRAPGDASVRTPGGRLLPAQRRAMRAIVQCRTAALGGSLYRCGDCGHVDYRYHSCRNRHCPTCQEDRAQAWLERVRTRLLPCDHYLVTFTLPHQLHAVARAHPRVVYAALLREAAAALQTLADDRTWVGGRLGILAVLHTWSRTLEYHPHVHLLVTAGGLAPDGTAWVRPAHPRFLMPGYMLSAIFRAKLHAALARAGLATAIDPRVWQRRWTVHLQPIGTGAHAIRYLARYIYRVALTNERLVRFADGRVTFRSTHARTGAACLTTLPVARFIARFLQHVLPRGFTKVRSYGVLSPQQRTACERARWLLTRASSAADVAARPAADTPRPAAGLPGVNTNGTTPSASRAPASPVWCCPICHRGPLRLVAHYQPARGPP